MVRIDARLGGRAVRSTILTAIHPGPPEKTLTDPLPTVAYAHCAATLG
jgi:hypothetical protein